MSSALITNQKEQIRQLLEQATSIGIIIGANQNIDTVAAALGLYLILQSQGKNVQIVSRREPTVELSNLFGIDRLAASFEGNTKILTISVPYREGEIEKVSYNIEDTRLNVNLFAENTGITFNERDIEYIKKGSTPSLIITIGVAAASELADLIDLQSVKTIHLDKNPLNSLTGDVLIVDPTFSSLSEIVTQLIIELGLGFDLDAYQNLMDGISFATRNFTNGATSAFAFEAAGFLLQSGARRMARGDRQGFRRDRSFARQDDRTFPKEEHLLPQKTQGFRPQSNNPSGQQSVSGQNMQSNSNPLPKSDPASSAPKEMTTEGRDMIEESPYTEGSRASEIPDDWFLPKVFKGSKKGN